MSMRKQDFVKLADLVKGGYCPDPFTPAQIATLATFCAAQNPNFKRERWLDYIAGKCGKNGGVK
jgi:hypothetical protein